MSLINTKIKPFKATAYHNGKFVPVSNETLAGKWSVFVFYPADFTFVCPTELEDLADTYAEFQKPVWRSTASLRTRTLLTRPGQTPLRPSRR